MNIHCIGWLPDVPLAEKCRARTLPLNFSRDGSIMTFCGTHGTSGVESDVN